MHSYNKPNTNRKQEPKEDLVDKREFRKKYGFSASQERCLVCGKARSWHTAWNTDPEFDHNHQFQSSGQKA